jgi:carboxymethylenebutenolidase
MKNIFYTCLIIIFCFSCSTNSNFENGKRIAICSSIEKQQAALISFSKDGEFDKYHPAPAIIDQAQMGEMISFSTKGKKGNGYLVKANSKKYLLMIHEWWGLNEQIKKEAEKYSEDLGLNVLALDMYDGKVATESSMARKYTQELSAERAAEILQGAIDYTGDNQGLATIGWCFGGAMSLQAALIAGPKADACVMYYGMPVMDKERLNDLKAPLLGIFAEKDGHITPEVVNKFESILEDLNKSFVIKSYDAEHAFANPTSSRYNQEAAADAYKLTKNFIQKHL